MAATKQTAACPRAFKRSRMTALRSALVERERDSAGPSTNGEGEGVQAGPEEDTCGNAPREIRYPGIAAQGFAQGRAHRGGAEVVMYHGDAMRDGRQQDANDAEVASPRQRRAARRRGLLKARPPATAQGKIAQARVDGGVCVGGLPADATLALMSAEKKTTSACFREWPSARRWAGRSGGAETREPVDARRWLGKGTRTPTKRAHAAASACWGGRPHAHGTRKQMHAIVRESGRGTGRPPPLPAPPPRLGARLRAERTSAPRRRGGSADSAPASKAGKKRKRCILKPRTQMDRAHVIEERADEAWQRTRGNHKEAGLAQTPRSRMSRKRQPASARHKEAGMEAVKAEAAAESAFAQPTRYTPAASRERIDRSRW
ncbi:hypothetical protein B0H11DRAFT_2324370 [Mycena galericulata]|nr:hypothetical protein B0H11DRAFT_2324370 [Mycena galericulata]